MTNFTVVSQLPSGLPVGISCQTPGSAVSFTLNTAYTHHSSGRALGFRYSAVSTEPINRFYVFVTSASGSGPHRLRCQIYDENPTVVGRPGSTLHATSDDVTLSGTDFQWVAFEFPTPYEPTFLGETLFFVVHNISSTPSTNTIAIRYSNTSRFTPSNIFSLYSTTGGFSGAGSRNNNVVVGAVEHGGPYYFGNISTNMTLSLSARTHGGIFEPHSDGYITRIEGFTSSLTVALEFRIYGFDQAPSDTPLYVQSINSMDRTTGVIHLTQPFRVHANRLIRVVFTRTASTLTLSIPAWRTSGYDVFSAGMLEAFYDDFTIPRYTTASTTGDEWIDSDDTGAAFALIYETLREYPSVAPATAAWRSALLRAGV